MLYYGMFIGNPPHLFRFAPPKFARLPAFSQPGRFVFPPCLRDTTQPKAMPLPGSFRLLALSFQLPANYCKMSTYQFGAAKYPGISTCEMQGLKIFRMNTYRKIGWGSLMLCPFGRFGLSLCERAPHQRILRAHRTIESSLEGAL